ncbi:pentapeptide repeat-containing protein [Streptomyces anulatus]
MSFRFAMLSGGDVSFDDTTFNGDVYFDGAEFSGPDRDGTPTDVAA